MPVRKFSWRTLAAPLVLCFLFLVITLSAVSFNAHADERSDKDLSDEGTMKGSRQFKLKSSISLAITPSPSSTPEIPHTLVAAFYDAENLRPQNFY